MGIWLDRIKARERECSNKKTLEEIMDRVAELLNGQGWVAIKSSVLDGEIVIWARDGKVAIPTRWQSAVKYTVDELNSMAYQEGFTEDKLRLMHRAKKAFGVETITEER